MKRLITIVLLGFYFITSVGASLSFHFCGESVKTVAINSIEKEACCCGDKELETNCCKDTDVSLFVDQQDYLPLTSKTITFKVVKTILFTVLPQFSISEPVVTESKQQPRIGAVFESFPKRVVTFCSLILYS